jgi:hypothetical protein
MNRPLYKETQTFRQPWMWFIIFIATAATVIFFAIGINRQIIHGQPYGDNPMSDTGLIVMGFFSLLIMAAVIFLVLKAKLIIEITEHAIIFRFPPFINKSRVINRNEIDRFEVRKYKPIREYGGWGIRLGMRKSGIAYNVHGSTGLQLYLVNGRKILLGTQRKDAIHSAMEKMIRKG